MFENYWANIIRYYTNKVHLRGLRVLQKKCPMTGFESFVY